MSYCSNITTSQTKKSSTIELEEIYVKKQGGAQTADAFDTDFLFRKLAYGPQAGA